MVNPNPVGALFAFLHYWYFRYTLVTELYMVEKWERNFMTVIPIQLSDIFLLTVFCGFFLFNYKVLLPATDQFLHGY